jgi:FkbM family methyltransferase
MIADFFRSAGNTIYQRAFPIYQPLYRAFKAYHDRSQRKLLAAQLGPGSVVVDAGANIGIYSSFLSRCVGPGGLVHSFEPDPANFARLQGALADASNVRLNQFAIGDRSGDSLLYVSDTLNVDHRTYPIQDQSRPTTPIKVIRLDDYFIPGAHVDLIKMDIQGYEVHGLRGAERVLSDNPGVKLLLECWPLGLLEAGTSILELLQFLQERDFECYQEHEGRFMRPVSAQTIQKEGGYFDVFACRKNKQAITAFLPD